LFFIALTFCEKKFIKEKVFNNKKWRKDAREQQPTANTKYSKRV
jgi:hypothetical protein